MTVQFGWPACDEIQSFDLQKNNITFFKELFGEWAHYDEMFSTKIIRRNSIAVVLVLNDCLVPNPKPFKH